MYNSKRMNGDILFRIILDYIFFTSNFTSTLYRIYNNKKVNSRNNLK